MRSALLAILGLTSASGAAADVPDRLRAGLSSPGDVARFAVGSVCLDTVVRGRSLESAVGKSGFPWKRSPGAFALLGRTPNEIRIDQRGYFRLSGGDGAALRLDAIRALADAGYRTQVHFDNGPDSRDGAGKHYRQESHCVFPTGPGKPLMMLISSSPDRGRTPLQVSVWADRDGKCKV